MPKWSSEGDIHYQHAQGPRREVLFPITRSHFNRRTQYSPPSTIPKHVPKQSEPENTTQVSPIKSKRLNPPSPHLTLTPTPTPPSPPSAALKTTEKTNPKPHTLEIPFRFQPFHPLMPSRNKTRVSMFSNLYSAPPTSKKSW